VLDLEPELALDQLAQGIVSEPGIVVDFRRAFFIGTHTRKLAGRDLAAEAVGGLVDRHLAGGADLGGEMPRGEQSARSAADDGDAKLRRSGSVPQNALLFVVHFAIPQCPIVDA